MHTSSQRNRLKLLLGLVLIHVFYFIVAWVYKKITNDDSPEYLWLAQNIKERGWIYCTNPNLPFNPTFISLRPPVYGFFILLVNLIHPSVYTILIFQNLVSIGVFMLLAETFRLVKPEIVHWQIIVVALILSPVTLRLANSVLSDTLFQAFLFLAFFSIVLYFKNNKLKFLIFYNIFLLLALFTKPSLLFFWLPNLLFSIYLFYLNRKPLILLLTVLLPLSVYYWNLRNEKLTGYAHFSSITSQNIIECYSYYPMQAKYGQIYADSVRTSVRNKAKEITNYKERSEFLHREGTKIIKENLGAYIYIHLRGIFSFMIDPGKPEIEAIFPYTPKEIISFRFEIDNRGFWKGLWYYLNHVPLFLLGFLFVIIVWNLVVLASFLYFIFNKQNAVMLRLAVFMFVGYIGSVSIISGLSRFRNGVMPILLFTVPFFIADMRKLYLQHKQKVN